MICNVIRNAHGEACAVTKLAISCETRCKKGIYALSEYHKEWDEETRSFSETPVHDWSSNPADAFRTGSVLDHSGRPASGQTVADANYNLFSESTYQHEADSDYSVIGA